jgi:DNA polymerase III sliding clamp (beta) subunit (PCNA family)
MKIMAQAGEFARALSLVALGVKHNAVAGIGAVQIAATDGNVSLAGTDMKVAIAAKAIATTIEPGNAATSADRLSALVGGLPASASVTITTNETTVAIACGHHRSRLSMMPWAELPSLISVDDETGMVEISGADALELLSPLPAAATEATRFYLCGLHWQTVDDKLFSCATNGTKLIMTSIAAGKFSEGRRDLILPREAAAILARLLKSAKPATVTLRRSKRLIAVNCTGFSFVSKLIDYVYPDCRPVIPPASSNWVTCNRAQLLAAIARLEAVATAPETPLLVLSFDGAPQLDICLAREPDNGMDRLDAEAAGAGKVAVQISQLADMIGEIPGEFIRLEATGGRPLRILGDGAKLALVNQCHWNFEAREPTRD